MSTLSIRDLHVSVETDAGAKEILRGVDLGRCGLGPEAQRLQLVGGALDRLDGLVDRGLRRLRVLGTPRRQVGLAGYGLEITGYITKE